MTTPNKYWRKMAEASADLTYFWLGSVKLMPGSIIAPGNWGRMLRRYIQSTATGNSFGNAWILARELNFEVARLKHFPDKPSRLESAFCCLSVEEARAYQRAHDPIGVQLLHRVQLVEPTAVSHVAAIDWTAWPQPDTSLMDVTEQRAMAYWRGDPTGGPSELITTSALKVVENVD